MSGAGKSTLLLELARRGWQTVDTDYGSWVLPDGQWDEARMTELLTRGEPVVVAGTVENQGDFYPLFDEVLLLTAPIEVLLERIRTRVNNPYGKSESEQRQVVEYWHTVEPQLRRGATRELDGTRTVNELANEIEVILRAN